MPRTLVEQQLHRLGRRQRAQDPGAFREGDTVDLGVANGELAFSVSSPAAVAAS